MARTIWYASLGYLTTQVRDQVRDEFAAAVQPHLDAGTIAPDTEPAQLPDIPAGLADATVYALPGVAHGYRIPHGWDSTDDWAALATILQEQAETGSYGITTVL